MKQSILALLVLFIACRSAMQHSTDPDRKESNPLTDILNTAELKPFAAGKDSLNIQVIYTRIDRNNRNEPRFTDFTFNLDSPGYFYPASTVKMPLAFLALEKLQQLRSAGVDRNTTLITDSNYTGEHVTYTEPMAEDSRPSIAHFIRQIFLVSDNEACNRLYEFLGQEYILNKLREKGFNESVIRHRLAVVLSQEQNRHTNAVTFTDTAGNALYQQAPQYSRAVFPAYNDKAGKGYYSGDNLVNEPFDFSFKNHVSLRNLHGILRSMLFPQSVPAAERFDVAADDRAFLLRWMSSFPRESRYPFYDPKEYPDDYCKFLGRALWPDSNIRIFSKSGWAYGYLTDVAYVVDFAHGVEFMLSATILCNSDGIFNDDHYDFEQTGYPFMRKLGKAVYDYELKRNRKHQPDLSAFRFDYTGK